MQVFYWWFNGLERFEARAARQREAEDQRVAGRAPRRHGSDEMDVEARLGAVVPRGGLPGEPALGGVPAAPTSAREGGVAGRFAGADWPDVSVVEDDAARSRPVPHARPKRPV